MRIFRDAIGVFKKVRRDSGLAQVLLTGKLGVGSGSCEPEKPNVAPASQAGC